LTNQAQYDLWKHNDNIEYIQMSFNQNYATALLEFIFDNGHPARLKWKCDVEAFQICKKAVELGCFHAYKPLAKCYKLGVGVAADTKHYLHLLREGASHGIRVMEYMLSKAYRFGFGPLSRCLVMSTCLDLLMDPSFFRVPRKISASFILSNITPHKRAHVKALMFGLGGKNRSMESVDWICRQHPIDAHLILSKNPIYRILIDMIKETLPMPIADEICEHVRTSQWKNIPRKHLKRNAEVVRRSERLRARLN
jgi:TPR repeat protein